MSRNSIVVASSIGENLDRAIDRLKSSGDEIVLLAKAGHNLDARFPGIRIIRAGGEPRWSESDLTSDVLDTIRKTQPFRIIIVYRGRAGAGGYENVESLGDIIAEAAGARVEGFGSEGVFRAISGSRRKVMRGIRRAAATVRLVVWLIGMPLFAQYIRWAHRREFRILADRKRSG
jgi:hypothetical protein